VRQERQDRLGQLALEEAEERANERKTAAKVKPGKRRDREPDGLPIEAVSRCEMLLRKRSVYLAEGRRAPHELTLEQIGGDPAVGFNRERVRHAEQLLRLGWPLQKRHPDFSAKDGFVKLPSVEKAAKALGLSDDEAARRLAETSLPLT
jgi:hypothetical protein